uniref:Galactose mutarotase n=1 Tax=Chrysemys picta bellii TaxID=8478 RepID=A0A8C3HYK0_CHRPI
MRLQLSFRLAEYWLASLFQRGARKTYGTVYPCLFWLGPLGGGSCDFLAPSSVLFAVCFLAAASAFRISRPQPAAYLGVVVSLLFSRDIQLWGEMTEVTREVFGHLPQKGGGGAVEKFLLKSDRVQVEIISLGCIITALETKGRDGNLSDIVLGFDRLEGYVNKHPYFGATIGRVANRIANGKFTVEGKEYQLALNNPPNSLHGGNKGFDKVLWTPEVLLNGIRFSRTSPDGEEGYPGELKVWVTYTLDGGELAINYRAQSSSTTPISLTNHAYFNLAGQGSHDIYNHMVSIEADSYLPVDDTLIPTGLFTDIVQCFRAAVSFFLWFLEPLCELLEQAVCSSRASLCCLPPGEVAAVQDTAFDLRKPVELGRHMQKFQLPGFDHNFCLEQSAARHYCARAHHPPSGRTMEVYTTQPGIQFYTGNFLDGSLEGKGGSVYPKHSAFCLETQNWPDAVNKPHFPSALLRPGEEYNHTTWLKFTAA